MYLCFALFGNYNMLVEGNHTPLYTDFIRSFSILTHFLHVYLCVRGL